jgi:hypothetical protein
MYWSILFKEKRPDDSPVKLNIKQENLQNVAAEQLIDSTPSF